MDGPDTICVPLPVQPAARRDRRRVAVLERFIGTRFRRPSGRPSCPRSASTRTGRALHAERRPAGRGHRIQLTEGRSKTAQAYAIRSGTRSATCRFVDLDVAFDTGGWSRPP